MSTFINCPLFNNVVFLLMEFPHNIPYRPSILITGSLLYATLLHAADEDNGSCTQSIFYPEKPEWKKVFRPHMHRLYLSGHE
jgi:hypothetical protein